eukprot:2049584-Lingulodinium_polyedra.AAC.1
MVMVMGYDGGGDGYGRGDHGGGDGGVVDGLRTSSVLSRSRAPSRDMLVACPRYLAECRGISGAD